MPVTGAREVSLVHKSMPQSVAFWENLVPSSTTPSHDVLPFCIEPFRKKTKTKTWNCLFSFSSPACNLPAEHGSDNWDYHIFPLSTGVRGDFSSFKRNSVAGCTVLRGRKAMEPQAFDHQHLQYSESRCVNIQPTPTWRKRGQMQRENKWSPGNQIKWGVGSLPWYLKVGKCVMAESTVRKLRMSYYFVIVLWRFWGHYLNSESLQSPGLQLWELNYTQLSTT